MSDKSVEKRKARRRPILHTFSVFVVVPKKGVHRLQVHDISDFGVGFDLDTEGENQAEFPVKKGDRLDVRFYLNQSLYLPLSVQVQRVEEGKEVRRVGAEFNDKSSKSYQGYLSFLRLLDTLSEVVQLDEAAG